VTSYRTKSRERSRRSWDGFDPDALVGQSIPWPTRMTHHPPKARLKARRFVLKCLKCQRHTMADPGMNVSNQLSCNSSCIPKKPQGPGKRRPNRGLPCRYEQLLRRVARTSLFPGSTIMMCHARHARSGGAHRRKIARARPWLKHVSDRQRYEHACQKCPHPVIRLAPVLFISSDGKSGHTETVRDLLLF
jgi:hypothetical protein